MNSVRSNNLSLKYRRFKPSDCEDIEIRKFELVAKTQYSFQLKMKIRKNKSRKGGKRKRGSPWVRKRVEQMCHTKHN